MRTWMTATPWDRCGIHSVWIDMPDYYPVTIYKDTTGQYTDDECDRDNCVEIPVPKQLLLQWFRKEWNIDRDFEHMNKEYGYTEADVLEDLKTWVYEESTADDSVNIYGWLMDHGYYWKRLD